MVRAELNVDIKINLFSYSSTFSDDAVQNNIKVKVLNKLANK